MNLRNIVESDFYDCFSIVKKSWPEFKERESIYHLFTKYFYNTSFVVEKDGKIVSFLLGFLSQVDNETAYIHLVSTEPQYQNKGIASDLYRKFFETAEKMGRKKICLIVNPDNAQSLKFHEKMGFSPTNTGDTISIEGVQAMKDYNGPNNHMVKFTKRLN